MAKGVNVTAQEVYKRKMIMRIVKIALLLLLLFFATLYLILYIVNNGGYFTIKLDPNLHAERSIIMSTEPDFNTDYVILRVKGLEYMDNITESWIPPDVAEKNGDNSADNYIAYTFYIKNAGTETVDYTRKILIESVIKDVDEATRVAVIFNDEKTVYAKKSASGKAEENTTPFESNFIVMTNDRDGLEPNQTDKYTILIWLEGNDPECIDNIIGGEMKMSMVITQKVE